MGNKSHKKDYNILLMGFDESGKIKIFNHFKYFDEHKNNIPSIGFNLECIYYKGCNFTLWILGGDSKNRVMWRNYFQNAHAIILVIDSTDKDNIEDANEEIRKLSIEEELKGCPILIMANRQDLENALSPEEIKKELGEITERKFDVKGTSAKTGQGIQEAFEWILNTLMNKD